MFNTFKSSFEFGKKLSVPSKTWTGTTTGLQLNYLNAPISGNTWIDASGNNRNGTVYKIGTGSAPYTSAKGGGLTFGPSVNTNASMLTTSYNLSAPFTIEIVANLNSSSFWATLFGNEVFNSSLGWFAYWGGSTTLQIGSTSRTNSYSVSANTGSTRHFVIVIDNTPSATLYINGSLINPTSTAYSLAPSVASNGLNFGSRHPNDGSSNVPTDSATGTYYQMRVYNIALNSTQVTNNYNAVKSSVSGGYGLP